MRLQYAVTMRYFQIGLKFNFPMSLQCYRKTVRRST